MLGFRWSTFLYLWEIGSNQQEYEQIGGYAEPHKSQSNRSEVCELQNINLCHYEKGIRNTLSETQYHRLLEICQSNRYKATSAARDSLHEKWQNISEESFDLPGNENKGNHSHCHTRGGKLKRCSFNKKAVEMYLLR